MKSTSIKTDNAFTINSKTNGRAIVKSSITARKTNVFRHYNTTARRKNAPSTFSAYLLQTLSPSSLFFHPLLFSSIIAALHTHAGVRRKKSRARVGLRKKQRRVANLSRLFRFPRDAVTAALNATIRVYILYCSKARGRVAKSRGKR